MESAIDIGWGYYDELREDYYEAFPEDGQKTFPIYDLQQRDIFRSQFILEFDQIGTY